MPTFLIKEAADLLGISTDALRRWADGGRIATTTDTAGRMAIDGAALATCAQELAESADHGEGNMVVAHSARNRFSGLVSRVVRNTVMAQVEIQAGPHRFVSLLSREAADELGLRTGNARSRRRQSHQRFHRNPQDQLTQAGRAWARGARNAAATKAAARSQASAAEALAFTAPRERPPGRTC